jgi:hypothetical protein
VLKYALVVPVVWLLKSIAYRIIFHIRTIEVTFLTCLIIAGAPLLLGLIPGALPGFMSIPVEVGIAVYLTMHYTHVALIPEGLFIPLGVEATFMLAVWLFYRFV